LLFGALVSAAAAQDSRESVDQETSKPVVRGSIVFKAYCTLCHGERGDGTGRGAKAHARLHLAIKPGSPEFYISVVREGGQSPGISPYMPPWKDELSVEQIADVVAYLAILHDSARRGEAVFKLNCMLCHGVHGDGNGRAGRLSHPPPADLTRSTKDDLYKAGIISSGGAAMGRSSNMPPWGKQLSETEIQDLVQYLKTLLVVPSASKEVAPKGEH
jgi:cytochrome c oxidase cbb3-type subunit 3